MNLWVFFWCPSRTPQGLGENIGSCFFLDNCCWYGWWFRNPKQPPGMYKNLSIMWDLPYQLLSRISEPSTVSIMLIVLNVCSCHTPSKNNDNIDYSIPITPTDPHHHPPCRAYSHPQPLGFPLRYWRESSVVRSSPATKKPPMGKLRVATKNKSFSQKTKNRDRQKDIKIWSSWHWWHFENIQESILMCIYIHYICGFLNHLILWHPVIKWSCCFWQRPTCTVFFGVSHLDAPASKWWRWGRDFGAWFMVINKALLRETNCQ